MSPLFIVLPLFFAAYTQATYNLSCQPPGQSSRFFHVQDVSPDMLPLINRMKAGALQQFVDWSTGLFTSVSSAVGYFNAKGSTCWALENSFSATSAVTLYSGVQILLGVDQPQRPVLDAIVHAANVDWDVPLAQGRRVIIVYTSKEPTLPPSGPFAPFDPNNIDCNVSETPSMAEFTSYMNNASNGSVYVLFVVPDNLINSYRTSFAWMGNRLSVVSHGADIQSLADSLFAGMNELYCGVDPPTLAPLASTALVIPPTCAESTVLQLLHLQDFSWSYSDDLSNLKAKMPALLSTLQAQYFERQVALGTFVDKAIAPSGYWTDYCYREQSTFSTDSIPFINALNAASIRSGRDWAESQYDAIRDGLESTTLGWMTGNSTAGGTKHLLRVVMLATDAGPHTKGDQSGLPATHADGCAYADYPSHADIKALLEAYNVYPIFLVTNNVYHYYNHLLNNEINSNGKVLRLADFETAIVDAITEALEELCVDTRRQLSNY